MKTLNNPSAHCIKSLLAILLISCGIARSHAQAWNTLGSAGFSAGEAAYTTMAIDQSGTPYVFYEDVANGYKATVMKYNGSSWVAVGAAAFSAGGVYEISMAIAADGTPYVAYSDAAHGYKATMMKYDGSSWVTVGSAGFSASQVHYTSLAIGTDGSPYLVYQDAGHSMKATAMKYDGSGWVTIGSAGFSYGIAKYTSLAMDASGTPYVAYEDVTHGYGATVMKYDGTSWTAIGTPGFSAGTVQETSIALDRTGTPYIVYQDCANSNKATVMKFDGSTWSAVGGAGFSAGATDFLSIAMDSNNIPYVVYEDNAAGHKATSKKFDGTTWVNAGNSAFSAGSAVYNSIALDQNGIAYVAYKDYTHAQKATVMVLKLPAITGASSVCTGSAATLSDAANYGTWSSSTPTVATIDSLTGLVSALATGIDTITYTVAGVSTSTVININASPNAGAISGAANICIGSAIAMTTTTPGGIWTSSTAAASVSDGMVVGVTTGAATLTYTVVNGCGSAMATHVINVFPHPAAGTVAGGADLCQGDHITLTASTTGGSWISQNANATVVGGTVTGVAGGTDAIMYVQSNACASDTAFHTVTITALPYAGTVDGPSLACSGTQITLTDLAPGGVWSTSNPVIATVADGIVTAIAPGTVDVSYTVANGACTLAATRTVNINPVVMPSTTISIGTSDSIVHPGQIVTFYANETYGGSAPTFRWYVNGVFVPSDSSNMFSTTVYGNDTIRCIATSNLACAVGVTDTSNAIVIYGSYLAIDDVHAHDQLFAVYPNPNNGSFTFKMSSITSEDAHVVITNVMGQKMKEMPVPVNVETHIALDVPAGIYLITAVSGEHQQTARVVVQ